MATRGDYKEYFLQKQENFLDRFLHLAQAGVPFPRLLWIASRWMANLAHTNLFAPDVFTTCAQLLRLINTGHCGEALVNVVRLKKLTTVTSLYDLMMTVGETIEFIEKFEAQRALIMELLLLLHPDTCNEVGLVAAR